MTQQKTDESQRVRALLTGVGNRGTTMWGRELRAGWGDRVEIVGIVDHNSLRATRARAMIGADAPIFATLPEGLAALSPDLVPDLVIVSTPDDTHEAMVCTALKAGCDVICEKPMAVTPESLAAIRAAEAASGRRVDISFNYRFAPSAATMRGLIADGAIGTVTSVDFHWYLDTQHGADYFRRWHAFRDRSGSLWVHKATHHFDLLAWYLDADPVEVMAQATQRVYGANGPFRGTRCHGCAHAQDCAYYFDMEADPFLWPLYGDPAAEDGYFRDACVFRPEIDIPDTMTATIRYSSGALVSYSLNTYMPIEGHHIAFNGTHGRIELRQHERQPWDTAPKDEIKLIRNDGSFEVIEVPHEAGGHYGGDDRLRATLFSGRPDPLGQRAGTRAGAISVLTGLAARRSAEEHRPVAIAELAPEGLDLRHE